MDVSTLLEMLQLLFPPPLRGASNCQDIDIGSCHSDYGTKERGNDFILILHYCKQEVLKHLDATLLDFILLFSEFDDERFNPINFLYALGSLAFKQGSVECLESVQTVVIENYHDSPDASFLMNDLGVMLSLKAMYKRSEECFSKAKKLFQQEEDHLKNAVVTLNLAALYMILGEYKKACEFYNDAADLCHDITMRSTKDIDLPVKVLRRTADLLSECGNFEKFCHILRIGGKYNFGARKASKIDVRKWLMEIQLKEQTGEKVEEQELKDCSSYLLTFLEKPDAQSLNADLMRTVFTAARVNHRNGLHGEAFKLLEKLESTLLLTGGRKDLLYGMMLFLVGRFKYMYGCGMTMDAENDLKQADAILEKHFGRNHVFAYCKKLLGSCALLNNNLGNASTNLAEASAFFEDLNSKHYEVAALEDSSPEPAVHVSYFSYEFSNKRTAELAFDYLAFSASKEPLLNDVKAVKVADGHSPYMNFAFSSSQHSRYSHFSVFVDKELPVLRVKCCHLNESKSNGFCCSVKSALENVMYFLCEDFRISFKPFVQLSCGVCSMVGFRGSLDVNCIVAAKTESSFSSPQAEEAMYNTFARDCFTEKELDCSTKQVLNSVTCRHSTFFHHQGSSSEASTSNCSNESDQNPFSSSRTSLCGAKAQVLKSDFDKECHVSKLQNQEVCSGSHADVYLRLLEYLLSDRNVTPEHEALNSVVPDSGVEERSLLSADFLSASSWNSVPVSPESFCSRDSLPSASSSPSGCISLHEKFEGEPCEWSDVDLANSCLAKVQNKSETKETHRYAEMCQLKSQLSEEETPDNCDSIDGVLKQLESNVTCEEPFGESKEYPDVQIGANCHPQCKNSLEEIELSAAEGTGVRGSSNSGIDRFVLSKDEESATFQNNCFELQQQINKLEEKLRQTEAEKQQLKADLGRYLFLEDREKRTGKLLSAPRAFTGDEIRCCGGSTSSKSATGKLLGRTASLQDKPDFNFQTRFIEISNSLLREEFKQMKILARGKVDGYRLAKMKVGFELLKEVERVSEHPCTDIGLLLKEIQRLDLVEKLGLPSPESKINESSGTSSASLPSRDDQGGERCTTLKSCTSTMGFAHRSEDNGQKFTPDHVYDLSASASFNIDSENPVSINIEDNDPLSMESVGTKEGICVPVSSEQSGQSSGASSVCVNALRTAEGSPVCSRSSSQGSSKKSAKAPEVVLTSHSASAPHRVRPYFGACHAAAVGIKSYVRSDGSAFSDVSIGGFERVGLLGGSSNNESLYGNSAHAAAAPLRNQTGLSDVTFGWNGSSSNGVNNVDGFLNIDHGVTGQRDYSRESYFPYVQQSNTVSEITRSGFAYGLTSSDFTLRGSGVAGIQPLPSVYTTQRHVMSDGDSAFKDEQAVNERSHNADLALGHQSLANINRHHILGTSASAGSAVIVDNCGLPPPFSVSSSSVSSTTVVSTTTSRSLVVSASNHTRSLVKCTSRNSLVSSTTPGDGNAETSLAPSSRNADEDHSRGALLNRDNGMNNIEPIDDSLLALEGRVADASALVERVLGEREEWEQFEREMERKERMNRERQETERREREEREIQEAEQWPQQQEAVSARSPWLCEHYQRHCRVRFPCCTQFYPCHRCHNTSRNCENEEAKACHVTHLKCSFCEHEQETDENSGVCGKCGAKVAAYLCSICKHFTNVDKNPYHCEKCGICRIHAGKSFQCEVCNVCLDKRLEENHKCRPDSSHNECSISLEDVRSCLLSNRNVRPGLEALNSVVPHIESIEEHSFTSSAFPSPSLNSLSVSQGDPFNQEEPCECLDEDLAAGCLAKAQSKPETRETHHYADVFQLKTELNEKENSDNCDSIDGVPKQLGSIVVSQEPLGESNECPDMQIGANPHPQCQNSVSPELSSPCDPFTLRKSSSASSTPIGCFGCHKKLQEEPLADGCLAKAQSKPTAKETHQYADVCQFKTELNEKEIADNCHSLDGVLKQPESIVVSEVPFGESNECPDMQIGANPHPQCQNSSEEMEVSAANGIGVRAPRNRVLDLFMLSKKEESATFQNNSFELLEQINELKEQLRQKEAENQLLKAEVGRYLFLEDREKRSGKLVSVPRAFASDESVSCGASASVKCVTTNGRLLGGAASLLDNPDFNLQARFIDISNSLSAEEFKQMKTLARGKVDGFRLAKMKVGFELLKEVERVSEHPCTDIGELLKGIQRFDLLEKLGLPYPESKTSVSAGTSCDSLPSRDERLQDREQGLDEERCATQLSCTSTIGFAHRHKDDDQKFTPDHDCDLYASVSFESDSEDPVSINIEDNDLLPKDKVGASVKEGIFVPNCPDRSGPLSGGSSTSVSSSDSLALISTESTPVCSTSSSQGSFEKSAKAPELSLTTHSASARGEIVNESDLGLNTGNSEDEVPGQVQLLNSTDDVTDGGNTEVEDIEEQSADSSYGATRISQSDARTSPLFEYDSQISSSDSSVFCRLTDPVSSHVVDGNPRQLQQSSNAHGQTALRVHESDECSSSSTDWERLGARPKRSQTHRPQIAISPPPPPLIASPVSDGLAGDFLVRHSQDKAVHESLFANGRDFSILGNDTSQGTSFVDGRTNASEAYRVRPYFGACQAAAVGNNSLVRSDGNAFSPVPSGGFEREGLLSGRSYNERLYGNSAPAAAAAPLPSHTGLSNVTVGWNGSSSNGASNVDGFLHIDHGVTGQGGYSRESYFPYVQHSAHMGQVPLHWRSNAILGITSSGFAYRLSNSGLTFGQLDDGAAGIRPGQSLYATQRHVVSDGDSAFIDEQAANERSYNADRHEPGTTTAGSAVIVGNCGLPPQISVSASGVSSTRVVSTTTSRPLVVSASDNAPSPVNNTSRNSVVSSATPVDENAETSLAPVSVNVNENNSRGALLNRDNGTNDIEPIDDSLLALERRVADAFALVERMPREREEREQFSREIERRERRIRERRERERREREEREIPDWVRWLQELDDTSFGTPEAL